MVACARKKEETMKLIKFIRPCGGLEEARSIIAAKIASSLYLALVLYCLVWVGNGYETDLRRMQCKSYHKQEYTILRSLG